MTDINHVSLNIDGESNGPELCDIDLGDGYKECSNRNNDLHQKFTIEELKEKEEDIPYDDESLQKEIREFKKKEIEKYKQKLKE